MPVTEILVIRHGRREPWTLNPATGEYLSSLPFPTGLPADPPLAPAGVQQAQETGTHLAEYLGEKGKRDQLRIYSSPFYRCLETLRPTVDALLLGSTERAGRAGRALQVRPETGIGEWFPRAWFTQPRPEKASRLREAFFPWVDEAYESRMLPPEQGEKIHELHDRVAKILARLIHDVDDEYAQAGRAHEPITLFLCAHAATVISAGRALTGNVPDDYNEGEFQCFTSGLSKFTRRTVPKLDDAYFKEDWRNNGGVAGGWECALNSDCSHLSNGEQDGWGFNGDEDYDEFEVASKMGIKLANGSFIVR